MYAQGQSWNITKYARNLYLNGIYESVNCKMHEGLYLWRRNRVRAWVHLSVGVG